MNCQIFYEIIVSTKVIDKKTATSKLFEKSTKVDYENITCIKLKEKHWRRRKEEHTMKFWQQNYLIVLVVWFIIGISRSTLILVFFQYNKQISWLSQLNRFWGEFYKRMNKFDHYVLINIFVRFEHMWMPDKIRIQKGEILVKYWWTSESSDVGLRKPVEFPKSLTKVIHWCNVIVCMNRLFWKIEEWRMLEKDVLSCRDVIQYVRNNVIMESKELVFS